MKRPNRRKVLECGGFDTALVRRCPFDSYVKRCSKAVSRGPFFAAEATEDRLATALQDASAESMKYL